MKEKKVSSTGYDIDSYGPARDLVSQINLIPNISVEDMHPFAEHEFEAVWCAHVLEHCQNTGKALSEIYRVLKPEGTLFLMVPPFKHRLAGGHVNVGWNLGLLAYNLLLAGFDVKKGGIYQLQI